MREEVLGREWPYPLVGQLVGIRKSHDKAQANAPKLLDPARYHLNPRTDLNGHPGFSDKWQEIIR